MISQYPLQLNGSKTHIIVLEPSKILKDISISGMAITSVIMHQCLVCFNCVLLDSHLNFDQQIISLKNKCFYVLRDLQKI